MLRQTEPSPTQASRREEMVKTQLEARGIKDRSVLSAMRKVPRHRFVPSVWVGRAYEDGALPIGEKQTISQPYIVAWMTELIEPKKGMRVLEIGTGSGYQAAVLAECVAEVDTIEVIPELGRKAEALLRELGYRDIRPGSATDTRDGPDGPLTTRSSSPPPRPMTSRSRCSNSSRSAAGSWPRSVATSRTSCESPGPRGACKREILAPVRFVPMTGKAQGQQR